MESEDELLGLVDELRAFESKFGLGNRFNVFEAVNMVRQEIRHSRFLAFLLDPSESHGLGDKFLRALLVAAAKNHPAPPASRLALTISDCSNALVYCERDHFDITVQIPDIRLMFVVENKVFASERPDQLSDYRKHVENRYPSYKFMGLFLTRDGYVGEDERWSTLSYSVIADELKRILAEAAPGADIALVIRHYIELIQRRIVVSQELLDACRRIYAQHRTALDLIVEHGQVSPLAEAFAMFCASHVELSAFTTRPNDIYFVSKDWLEIPGFQVADKARWGSACPVKFWFRLQEKHLYLRLEVGPFSSGAASFDRTTLVQSLRNQFESKANKKTSEAFTRVLTKSQAVAEDAGAEDISLAMEDLWKTVGGTAAADKVKNVANACVPRRF